MSSPFGQVLSPIYRGEDVLITLSPPSGSSYTLTGSTFSFAMGVKKETPLVTIAATFVTTTINVVISKATTATLKETTHFWTLYETVSGGTKTVIADGTVPVVKGVAVAV